MMIMDRSRIEYSNRTFSTSSEQQQQQDEGHHHEACSQQTQRSSSPILSLAAGYMWGQYDSRHERCRTATGSSGRLNMRLQGVDRHWIWCIIVLFGFLISCSQAQSGTDELLITTSPPSSSPPPSSISTTEYSPKPPVFNINDCIGSLDSRAQDIFICRDNSKLFALLQFAESLAKKTCEEEFKNELWNCSGFSLLKEPAVTRGDDVFKESAYVYSLSLAAIAHTVARACSSSDYDYNCTCNSASGCQHNIEYSLGIAETFLNRRHTHRGSSLKSLLHQHNLEATKEIIHEVLNSTKDKCHCHGISGSCTFKTCYSELPEFSDLSTRIKKAFNDSLRVITDGGSSLTWSPLDKAKRIAASDLIYRDISPSWCVLDASIGSIGMDERECDPHDNEPNSCSKLCSPCGLTYNEHRIPLTVPCDCKFHFCCEVKCQVCVERKTYYTCSTYRK